MTMTGGTGGNYNLGTATGTIVINSGQLAVAAGALSNIGNKMLLVGGIALGAFAGAVHAAGNFEQQLSRFSAVTDATGSDMDKVREKALQLGRDSAYGADQVMQGFVEIGKAGLSAKDILAGVGDAAVTLAAAGEISMADSTKILVNAMRTFDLPASKAVFIANKLAGAANASTTEVADLAASLRYVGPVAHAAGIDFDSTAQALAILGNAGIRGSMAGTSLRGIMVQLTPTTEKATNEMKKLGIITADGSNKFFDASGKAKSFADIAQILQDSTRGLTKEQKIQAFTTLFQRRAMAAAIVLADQGKKGFRELAGSNQYATTAQEVMEKKLDNLNGALKILKSSLETAAIEVGGEFTPMIKSVADFIKDMVNAFINLPGPVKAAVGWFLLIFGVLFVTAGILAKISSGIVGMIGAYGRLAKAMGPVVDVVRALTGAVMELDLAFLANPITWIILAIILLIVAFVLLYTKVKWFRDFIDQTWQDIQKGWDKLLTWFKGLPKWFSMIWDKITGFFKKAADKVVKAWDGVVDFFKKLPGRIMGYLGDVFGPIGDSAQTAAEDVVRWFKDLPGNVSEIFGSINDTLTNFFANLPETIGYWLGFALGRMIRWGIQAIIWVDTFGASMIESFLGWLTQLPGIIWDWLQQAYQFIVQWGGQALSFINTTGTNILNSVVHWFSQLPGRIWGFLQAAFGLMVNWGGQALSWAANTASGIFHHVADWIGKIPGMVGDFFSQLPGRIAGAAGAVWDAAAHIGSQIWGGLWGMIKDIPSHVVDIFWKLVDGIGGFASTAWGKAKSIGESIWNGFWDGISGSPKTKVEYAVIDMVQGVSDQLDVLDTQVARMNKIVPTVKGFGVNAAVTTATGTGVLTPPAAATAPQPQKTDQPAIGEINIYNPTPEPAEESLFRTGQKMAYLGLVGTAS